MEVAAQVLAVNGKQWQQQNSESSGGDTDSRSSSGASDAAAFANSSISE